MSSLTDKRGTREDVPDNTLPGAKHQTPYRDQVAGPVGVGVAEPKEGDPGGPPPEESLTETEKALKAGPTSTEYPKTLYHKSSTLNNLIGKSVATEDEQQQLGGEWVSGQDLGFETAPAEGVVTTPRQDNPAHPTNEPVTAGDADPRDPREPRDPRGPRPEQIPAEPAKPTQLPANKPSPKKND